MQSSARIVVIDEQNHTNSDPQMFQSLSMLECHKHASRWLKGHNLAHMSYFPDYNFQNTNKRSLDFTFFLSYPLIDNASNR